MQHQSWSRSTRSLGLVASLAILTATVAQAASPPSPTDLARKQQLSHYGGGATLITARSLGVGEIMGKAIPTLETGKPAVPPRLVVRGESAVVPAASGSGNINDDPGSSPNNTAIRDFPNVSEDEPAVAVNPKKPNRLVAGTHFIGDTANRCVGHYSSDGGKTWNPRPIFMPQLTHESECSDPALAYAPDGSRVYYSYMDIKFSHYDVLVSYSDDDGKSWTGPVVALANVAADYDKPWVGTHVATGKKEGNNDWVYVTATRFDFASPGPCTIDFTRSSNKGQAWSAPQPIDTSGGACGSGSTPVVQGSRPAGGVGGGVLVVWYNSGSDGWLSGTFEIRTRYSPNNGATFNPIVVSALDTAELPYFLGPFSSYHRWWGGMFPDVEIAANGTGHIAYITDPVPGSATAEDGDVRYGTSAGPPYATWSLPVTVNDDASGKAQGWVALEASSKGNTTTVYAIWEDHRLSPSDNLKYDIFFGRKVGAGWSPNERVTDASSTSDYIFLGDYFDITVAASNGDDDDNNSGRFVFGVWTDRRDEPTVFDFDDDIWGAKLPPGSNGDNQDN